MNQLNQPESRREGGGVPQRSEKRGLSLCTEARAAILAQARALYPEEACGLLIGEPSGRVLQAAALINHADDRRSAYLIDAEDYLAAERRAEQEGHLVLGVWHSHPNGTSEPSATDTELAWPDWYYIIAAVDAGQCTTMQAWMLNGQGLEEEVIHP